MNNNLKVLKLFVDNKEKSFSIRKAAKALRMNYRIAYEEIMKLKREGLITMDKYGNANICSFSYHYHSKIVEVEGTRKGKLSEDIQLISKRMSELKSSFYCLILFGSHANKTNTKTSDIDLCIITDQAKTLQEAQALLRITPLPVHLQDFTSEQFMAMLKSKEPNVGNEIIKNNIILHGMEAFYEMVNRVKH